MYRLNSEHLLKLLVRNQTFIEHVDSHILPISGKHAEHKPSNSQFDSQEEIDRYDYGRQPG